MTPKQGQIENSFKLIKYHAYMYTHAKFGSDPLKNLRENWSQPKMRRNWLTDWRTDWRTDGENPVVELPIRQLKKCSENKKNGYIYA